MAEGFLGRWSQRKLAVREGRPVKDVDGHVDPAAASALPAKPDEGLARSDTRLQQPLAEVRKTDPLSPATDAPQPAPLSMQDVAALNAESDFTPFVARAVAPEVRNAAMKKLFADPHFNVMDGLDIYIDDYSIPDPLPASMLRKMVGAKFLKLFDDEEPVPVALGADSAVGDAPVVTPAGPFVPCAPNTPDTAGADATTPHAAMPDIGTTDPVRTNAAATNPDKTDPSV